MDQEKTYKWIQDRIRDLHAGTLTAEDRLRMEELAKTDPFVQDAMEGYQANPDHDHSVLLKVIADRIQHKNASRRPKILPLSRGWVIPAVAASLVLILATWAVMFYIEKQGDAVFVAAEPKTNSSIEHSTEVNLSDADSLNENASPSPAGNDNGPTEIKAGAQSASKPSVARKESAQKSKGENYNLDTPADDAKNSGVSIADKEVRESEEALSKEPGITSPAPPATQPPGRASVEMQADKSMAAGAPASKLNSKKDEGYYANQMNPDLMSRRVSGKVVDEITGEPLIFAPINIANTNLIELTDIDGNFDFYIPDTIADVIINYTGYPITSSMIEQGNSDIIIKLKTQGDPGVKIFKGTQPESDLSAKSRSLGANFRFQEYLKLNSEFPLQTSFNPYGKMVKMEFKLSQGQNIEKIKIIDSSGGKKYEEEAIRLLKMGPAWSCAEGKYPCTRVYTIYFK